MGSDFRLLALDPQGGITNLSIHASTQAQALREAADRGFTVVSCDGSTSGAQGRSIFAAPRKVDVLAFAQDLATLLGAGITIKESIATLARRAGLTRQAGVFHELQDAIRQGLRLSAAMEASGRFPALLVATVAASEQTGDVAIGLTRFAKHQQNLRTLRDKVVGACVYPALLLSFGSVVLMVLLGVVVPRFAQVMDVTSRDLPALSKWLMSWGKFASEHAVATPALFAVLLATLGALTALLVSARGRRWLFERIPGIKKLATEFQLLQVYRAAAILTSRGIPIQRALEYTVHYLGPRGREQLQQGLVAVREGLPLSVALARGGFADEMVASMLGVAERSGALPEMLDRIADFHERSLQRNVEVASRLVEPILMIVFGVLIGGIVLLMYLPIFDLASSVT